MKINGKEINLLPKRLAVEIFWTELAKDAVEFGSGYYEPFHLGLMIYAGAANWSKVNLKPKQIEFAEILDWMESDLSDEDVKQVKDYCDEFVNSNFYKEKTEKLNEGIEEIKKKNLTGGSSESKRTKRESKRKNTTG